MAIDNLPNGNDQRHLSGAYIRSLVKQLSTTTSKPCLNTTQNLNINNNDTLSIVPHYNTTTTTNNNNNNNNTMNPTTTKKLATAKPTHHQLDPTQHGHKKQVRRRLHTSRPYQERLLNMAEARKEIVTALKFHRATMKQANEKKHQHHQHQHHHHHQQYNNNNNNNNDDDDVVSSHHKVKSEPLLENNHSSTYYYSSYNRNHNNQNYYPLPSNNIISTQSSLVGPTPFYESLNNIALPHQTLGLNLNLQAFTNLDVKFFHNNKNSTTTTTTTATATTPSSTDASPSLPLSPPAAAEGVGPTNNNMHNPSLDEEEITKMRSIGEQFLTKMVDFGKDIKGCYYNNKNKKNNNKKNNYYNNENDHDILSEEELVEFPPWLGASNEESFLHHQPLDDSCSEDNTTLPWMDIEDIDGMDDEWLS